MRQRGNKQHLLMKRPKNSKMATLSNQSKTKIFYACILLAFLLFVASAKIARFILLTKGKISTCNVNEVRSVGRENFTLIIYDFTINKRIHRQSISLNNRTLNVESGRHLEGKCFPLIYYQRAGVTLSSILILPRDFKQLHLPYPDSLRWILPLLKKSSP